MIKKKLFFFYSALVLPKVKFRIVKFSNKFFLKKKVGVTTFWKSIARDSNNLSSMFLTWLSTLKKIKTRSLLLNFIWSFVINRSWCSFSQLDILNLQFRDILNLKKKVYELLNNSSVEFSVLSSNWTVNWIFLDFFYSTIDLTKSSYFFEKYFSKEKSAWTVTLSNTLKYFLIWFFSFFMPDFFLLKKSIINSTSNWLNNFTNKTLTFVDLFRNKWYFIFLKKDIKFFNWIDFINKLSKTLNIFELIYFFNGYVVLKSSQKNSLLILTNTLKINSDSLFLWFFFVSDRSFFLNTIDLRGQEDTNVFDPKKITLKYFMFHNIWFFDFCAVRFLLFLFLRKLILKKFDYYFLFNLKFLLNLLNANIWAIAKRY